MKKVETLQVHADREVNYKIMWKLNQTEMNNDTVK